MDLKTREELSKMTEDEHEFHLRELPWRLSNIVDFPAEHLRKELMLIVAYYFEMDAVRPGGVEDFIPDIVEPLRAEAEAIRIQGRPPKKSEWVTWEEAIG